MKIKNNKMNIYNNRSSILVLGIYCGAIGLSSCKKFVQINPPSTQLVTSSVFDNDATATAAQIVIYSQMAGNSESYNMELSTGLLGDELTNYSSSAGNLMYYTDAMTATKTNGIWVNAYHYIYEANAIIGGLANNGSVSPATRQQLIGESKFMRAFWLFYLTNIYGDIPLVTSTDYATNSLLARASRANVYQQIISDLKDAEGLLNSNYVDVSDTTITAERTRLTKWAAAALLARVYLFTGDFS